MEIAETKTGRTLVLAPSGRLDAASSPAFQERLIGRIEAGETCVLLDLAQLDYISSAGLRVVLSAAKRLQSGDGRFVVCGLAGNVREVFVISGFDTLLEIVADRAAAVEQLG